MFSGGREGIRVSGDDSSCKMIDINRTAIKKQIRRHVRRICFFGAKAEKNNTYSQEIARKILGFSL